jgi:hypothetical protein
MTYEVKLKCQSHLTSRTFQVNMGPTACRRAADLGRGCTARVYFLLSELGFLNVRSVEALPMPWQSMYHVITKIRPLCLSPTNNRHLNVNWQQHGGLAAEIWLIY